MKLQMNNPNLNEPVNQHLTLRHTELTLYPPSHPTFQKFFLKIHPNLSTFELFKHKNKTICWTLLPNISSTYIIKIHWTLPSLSAARAASSYISFSGTVSVFLLKSDNDEYLLSHIECTKKQEKCVLTKNSVCGYPHTKL